MKLILSAALAIAIGAQALRPGGAPAVPLEPVAAIVDAFRTHGVVAVTAGHGEARGYAFMQLLIHDPRIISTINDIVVEEGSARYQEVVDRFLRGEKVPIESLRHVWRDTTQPGLGYDTQWEEFYQALRSINVSQPAAHKVRVLLGDPPIDWENVKTAEEHRHWIEMRGPTSWTVARSLPNRPRPRRARRWGGRRVTADSPRTICVTGQPSRTRAPSRAANASVIRWLPPLTRNSSFGYMGTPRCFRIAVCQSRYSAEVSVPPTNRIAVSEACSRRSS
jgi:hypothetical protein